jgi:Ca2+:H+ antiporter
MVTYSADGILSTGYFIRRCLADRGYLGAPSPISQLAQGRSIDLSIQFLLFWMPVLVLAGWSSHKPMSLLFDVFEVVTILGACFLVNYVTADAKTNWAEGVMMVIFYFMIVSTL